MKTKTRQTAHAKRDLLSEIVKSFCSFRKKYSQHIYNYQTRVDPSKDHYYKTNGKCSKLIAKTKMYEASSMLGTETTQ